MGSRGLPGHTAALRTHKLLSTPKKFVHASAAPWTVKHEGYTPAFFEHAQLAVLALSLIHI